LIPEASINQQLGSNIWGCPDRERAWGWMEGTRRGSKTWLWKEGRQRQQGRGAQDDGDHVRTHTLLEVRETTQVKGWSCRSPGKMSLSLHWSQSPSPHSPYHQTLISGLCFIFS